MMVSPNDHIQVPETYRYAIEDGKKEVADGTICGSWDKLEFSEWT